MELHKEDWLTSLTLGAEQVEQEKRRRVRVSVRWEVRFCAGAETLLSTVTENVSCDGFYCVSEQPVAIGAHHCIVVIPARAPDDPSQALHLLCDVKVLRIDAQLDNRYGIAARIHSYHAVATAATGRAVSAVGKRRHA